MTQRASALVFVITLAAACGGGSTGAGGPSGPGGPGSSTASGFVEGKDYVVLERIRILDEMGFDKPVEAMSVLLPRGWATKAGVRWRGFQECRGEMITWSLSASSPDQKIRLDVYPTRSFAWFEDAMMRQSMMAAASGGGCAVNQPFNATQYLENLARTELGGAQISDVRPDENTMALIEKVNAQGNAIARQYGTGIVNSGSAVYGTLTWPDGTKGLGNIGLTVGSKQGRDMFSGRPNGFATTTVFHQVVIRYPPDREAEALKLFGTVVSSHRVNPAWQQAKDDFMMKLGNIEHKGRMDRLRMMGEQSAAYAKSASEASDARMRSWEQQNAASDANQHRFIQTIREVETWKDGEGRPVELSAGYSHGWSKPDGSYILTNNSNFNPAVEFQQNWKPMQRPVK